MRYEHKWKKSCVQYPWDKGFLTVSWCYHQFEPHVCLLNGMGVSHPAFPYSSSPDSNSIRGVLLLLPQEQSIHSGMKENNVGSSASIPFLLLLNPLTLSKAAQQPAPSSIELNCKSGDAVGPSHSFQFCVPVVPPHGTRADPEGMQSAFADWAFWWD